MIPVVALGGGVAGLLAGVLLRRRGYLQHTSKPPASWWWVALVAGVTAALWVALWASRPTSWPILAAGMGYTLAGLIAIWIDIDCHRIPDLLTLSVLAGLIGIGVTASILYPGSWSRLGTAALIGLAVGGGFTILALLTDIGWGDVKWMTATGAVLGWCTPTAVIAALIAAGLAMAVQASAALAQGRARTAHIPLAPALTIGALFGLLTGP